MHFPVTLMDDSISAKMVTEIKKKNEKEFNLILYRSRAINKNVCVYVFLCT